MGCRFLAVANQKGGVGKTATAVNVAAALAVLELDTLLVDLDPQANATGNLLNAAGIPGIAEVLIEDVELQHVVRPTGRKHLSIAPGNSRLSAYIPQSKTELREKIRPSSARYRFVVLDCPPALGGATVSALASCDEIVVPVQAEYLALEGLSSLITAVNRVRDGLAPVKTRYLLTMFDGRNRLAKEVEADLRRHFGDSVSRVVIPRSVRMAEAPGFRRTIFEHAANSGAADAYATFAEEVAVDVGR